MSRNDASMGRTEKYGHFIWYDLYRSWYIDADNYRNRARNIRSYGTCITNGCIFGSDGSVLQRIVAYGKPIIDLPVDYVGIYVKMAEIGSEFCRDGNFGFRNVKS